jgi:hypothetical protein
VQRFQIRIVLQNYLICRTWDGVTQGSTDVLVARPKNLRTTGNVNQRTISVTPDGGGAAISAVESITPVYAANDEIYACEPTGGTSLTNGNPPHEAVTWLDLNVDARTWMLANRVYEVCVNGVARKSVIRGGVPV